MVAAIVVGALIPLLMGSLRIASVLQHAFVVPVVCYLYISVFGFAARNLLTSTVPPELEIVE